MAHPAISLILLNFHNNEGRMLPGLIWQPPGDPFLLFVFRFLADVSLPAKTKGAVCSCALYNFALFFYFNKFKRNQMQGEAVLFVKVRRDRA